jgi:adenosylcobinamide-GDP ribazoletransferase
MKSILIAFQFLTRLPIRIKTIEPEDHARSMMWFPFVGIFIGLVLALIAYESSLYNLPGSITAALIILALVVITGGLHLDGLSDTCDGFYAGKDREETLRIMRDPHTGAMGVIGIVTMLLLKYAVLAELVSSVPFRPLYISLAITPMLSRWGMVMASSISPAAREDGKAQPFIQHLRIKHWLIATMLTYIIAIGLLGNHGFALCMIGLGPVVIGVIYFRQRIGGVTGDTLGALNEIIELIVLFSAYMMYRI